MSNKKSKKLKKGDKGGKCNLTRCTSNQPATWYNHGSHKHYCRGCAEWLNYDTFNKQYAMDTYGHLLCTDTEAAKEPTQ